MRNSPSRREHPGQIRPRCFDSGMPGSSWDAMVVFVPGAAGTQVWATPDLNEEPLTKVALIRGPFSKSACAAFLASSRRVAAAGTTFSTTRPSAMSAASARSSCSSRGCTTRSSGSTGSSWSSSRSARFGCGRSGARRDRSTGRREADRRILLAFGELMRAGSPPVQARHLNCLGCFLSGAAAELGPKIVRVALLDDQWRIEFNTCDRHGESNSSHFAISNGDVRFHLFGCSEHGDPMWVEQRWVPSVIRPDCTQKPWGASS